MTLESDIARLEKTRNIDGAYFSEGEISLDLAEKIMSILENSDKNSEEYKLVQNCQVSYMGTDDICYMILMFEVRSGVKEFFDFLKNQLAED